MEHLDGRAAGESGASAVSAEQTALPHLASGKSAVSSFDAIAQAAGLLVLLGSMTVLLAAMAFENNNKRAWWTH